MSKAANFSKDNPILGKFAGVRDGTTPDKKNSAVGPAPTRLVGVRFQQHAATIDLSRIVVDPEQPRKTFDPEKLTFLAASMQSQGQIQPVVVYWSEDVQKYMIVCGERRFRAASLIGLTTLDCKILPDKPETEEEIREIQLIENVLREDLSPIDQAHAYKALMEKRKCSTRELGKLLNISHNTIVNALNLLSLPEKTQQDVNDGKLPKSVAYAVATIDDPQLQEEVAEKIIQDDIPCGPAIDMARKAKAKAEGRTPKPKPEPRHEPKLELEPEPELPATTEPEPATATLPLKPTRRVVNMDGYSITIERSGGVDLQSAANALRKAADEMAAEAA